MTFLYTLLVILIVSILVVYIKVNHFEEERVPKTFEFVGYILTTFLTLIIFCEMGFPAYIKALSYNEHFVDIKPEEVELITIFENSDNYEYHFTIRGINNAAFVRVEKTTNKRDVEYKPEITCRYIDSDGYMIFADNMSDEVKNILLSRIEQSH